MKDCAHIALESNEQVTFTTDAGAEYDVARKAWGFYATPSLNARLLNFGLRAVIAKSYVGKYYLFLVERGQETRFEEYLKLERNEVVRWLDNEADLAAIEVRNPSRRNQITSIIHCPCGGDRYTSIHTYFEPPPGEVRFPQTARIDYRRELFQCSLCRHFVSIANIDIQNLYSHDYVNANYGDDGGIRRAFDRINALDPSQSDNAARVARVLEFAGKHFATAADLAGAKRSILDVGSGLCVFLHRMKASGWDCTALDPDPRAARHAHDTVAVHAVCGDFRTASNLARFDVISFNKVLEHVVDPASMLAVSAHHLNPGGFVYVELPDGEMAIHEGPEREEFFIDHFHIFSAASTALLAGRAGFDVIALERLREPSTKYTLRAFLVPRMRSEGER